MLYKIRDILMLIHLFKDLMCCSIFDNLPFILETCWKTLYFSLNKENHFTHYHAYSVSIKNQSSNACFQVLLVKLPIYAYSLAQQKFTQHHFFHYCNFVHLIKCFPFRVWGNWLESFHTPPQKKVPLQLKYSGRL